MFPNPFMTFLAMLGLLVKIRCVGESLLCCLGNVGCQSEVMYHFWPNAPSFVSMWVPCASVVQLVVYQGGSFLTTSVAPCCYYGVYIGGFGC